MTTVVEHEVADQDAAERVRCARHREAVVTVQRFLPDYASLPGASGAFLIFSPERLMELLGAVEQHGLGDR